MSEARPSACALTAGRPRKSWFSRGRRRGPRQALWLNPRAAAGLAQRGLFDGEAL